MHRDRAEAAGPGLDTAARCQLDLLRGILARGDARPEGVELDTSVRRPDHADQRCEVPQAVGLRIHLHRRVPTARDEERRRYAGVRARITLRVDALQPAERDAIDP